METAETGAEASERIAKWRPDVVVLDVNLPDISGIELMKRLRSDGLACDVIIITNQGSVSLAVEAMREGAVDFVMKPFSRRAAANNRSQCSGAAKAGDAR